MPPKPSIIERIIFFGDLFLPLTIWKKIIFYLSLILSLYFVLTNSHVSAAKFALITLSLVIFTKPFVKLFPTIGLFKTLLALRRQTGQASALFAFSHVLAQIFPSFNLVQLFQTSYLMGPTGYMFWGTLALILMFILAITSNDFSTKLLKRNWFLLQKLIHPLYIFTLIHFSIYQGRGGFLLSLIALTLLYWLRFLASQNVQLFTNLKPRQAL